MSEQIENKFCSNCGSPLNMNAKFCTKCGAKQTVVDAVSVKAETTAPTVDPATIAVDAKKIAGKALGKIVTSANKLTGETDTVSLDLKDLFSDVLKKHSKKEQEEIFICGTSGTTPKESELSSSWPKPWLYSRVFAMFAITFALLVMVTEAFDNINGLPGLIFVGSLAVPFSTIIFFFEANAPRNISIFEVVKIFFVGGALSLVATLILFEFVEVDGLDYFGATLVGVVEEVGKLLIVAFFCREAKVKYILNGLLIGSAVGAGFAVFETAGYALRSSIFLGTDEMLNTLYLRAILAIGGHVAWAAISGAALVAVKENNVLSKEMFVDTRFLKLFVVPIVLHAVWDMPLLEDVELPVIQIGLTVLVWIMLLVLINTGLKQISRLNQPATDEVTQ